MICDLRGATVEATAAYPKTADARRVVRHFVMVADQTVIVLDDILPAGNAKGEIPAQWQAHYPAMAEGGRAVITGDAASLHIRPHGPDVSFAIEGPRDFGRSWVYRRWQQNNWVQWHSIRGIYVADPARPLVTVLSVTDRDAPLPPAEVAHAPGRITVTVGDPRLLFTATEAGWRLERYTATGRRPDSVASWLGWQTGR